MVMAIRMGTKAIQTRKDSSSGGKTTETNMPLSKGKIKVNSIFIEHVIINVKALKMTILFSFQNNEAPL